MPKKGNKLNWIRREEKKIASKLVFARKSLSTSKFRFDRSVFWRAFLNRDLKPFFRKSFKIRSKFDIVLVNIVVVFVGVVAVAVIVVVVVVGVVVVDRSFGSRTQFLKKGWDWFRSLLDLDWDPDTRPDDTLIKTEESTRGRRRGGGGQRVGLFGLDVAHHEPRKASFLPNEIETKCFGQFYFVHFYFIWVIKSPSECKQSVGGPYESQMKKVPFSWMNFFSQLV